MKTLKFGCIKAILMCLAFILSSSHSWARTSTNTKYSGETPQSGFSTFGMSGISTFGASSSEITNALGLLPGDVISITTSTSDSLGFITTTTPSPFFPTQGSSYLILSTGDVNDVFNPNDAPDTSTVLSGLDNSPGNDMVQATLTLQPPSTASCLAFDFAYLSEEFPEYVGSQFNDAFIAEIEQSTFQIVDNQVIAPNNFAFDEAGNVISINTVFGVTTNNADGTTYDASTSLLTAKTPLENPGLPITITLSIMDLGDSIYDSTVFIDNFRWLYGVACEAGADTDNDRDGLLDGWETSGIDFNNDGLVDLDLPAMGADPNHKDIFVEIDYMELSGLSGHTHKPKAEALQLVIDAFRNAPVTNPDGTTGINLHIDAGPDSIMNPVTNETWGARSQSDVLTHQTNLGTCSATGYSWTEFDGIKGAGVPGNLSIQRADVFHYNIWAHNICPEAGTTSGIARGIPGSDFIVSLGGWSGDVGSVNQQAGTFMHELGHGLSLKHGGNDHKNYKPNYLSVMNYSFQTRGLRISGTDGNFDYSSFLLPSLDEAHLNEANGISSGIVEANNYGTRYYDLTGSARLANDINGNIDWSGEGVSDTDIGVDINKSGLLTVLGTVDNWDEIVFTGGSVGHLGEQIVQPEIIHDPEGHLADITQLEDSVIPTEYGVSLTGPHSSILAPKQSRTYNYQIKNTGSNKDSFTINATSSSGWSDTAPFPIDVEIEPGQTMSISIVITVPVYASVGQTDTLHVTAHSSSSPAMIDSITSITTVNIPTEKSQCKNNGWMTFGYINQGQCIKYFNTGK